MKIEDIRLFERIAHLKSVSAGGTACGLSATAASDGLKRLEGQLGCVLLNRTTRSVSLTDDGQRFLERALPLLENYEALRHSVGSRAAKPTGTLRLTAPALFGRLFLPKAIRDYHQLYPDVSLDIALSDEILDYTALGIDLAIRIGNLPASSLRATRIADNERLLVAAPDYLARKGTPEHPDDLARHECLIYASEDRWPLTVEGEVRDLPVSGMLRSASNEIILQAAKDGLGISLRSRWAVHRDLADSSLVQVLPDFPVAAPLAIWAIFPPGRFISPAAKAFVSCLRRLDFQEGPALS